MNASTEFRDLHKLSEDDRIKLIGEYVTQKGMTGAVLVDDVPNKIERYVKKIRDRFPGIAIIEILHKTPIDGVATIKVGPQ